MRELVKNASFFISLYNLSRYLNIYTIRIWIRVMVRNTNLKRHNYLFLIAKFSDVVYIYVYIHSERIDDYLYK